jgi:hypothetical protein
MRKCRSVGRKEQKKELNTLDEADFVKVVENRHYHQQIGKCPAAVTGKVGSGTQVGFGRD